MAPELLLGVDGGGTQTTALLADSEGRVLGRGTAGSSNVHAAGEVEALAALRAAIGAAFSAAHLAEQPPAAACLGLAGAARPDDRERLRVWAAQALPTTALQVVTDAELVLAAGTPEGWGLAIISGTGSIAFGRAPDGRTARAGGWGWAIGDEGSGYALGLAALRAVARAADGRGPRTTLTDAICAHWSLPDAEALIGVVYRFPYPRREIATLAALVEETAALGDEVAGQIVRESGRELALAAGAVVQALSLVGPVPAGLAGGVLVGGQQVRQALLLALAETRVHVAPTQLVPDPALGAIILAHRSG